MKIVKLEVENIKRLVAVSISPDGNMVQITGANGQGKTSVLDSIWWALAGTSNVQKAPIRKGQSKARIKLDLGEFVVTRTFTKREDDTTLTSIAVESADGAKFASPQALLDGLLGSLTFDPLAFARMDAKAQVAELKALVPGFDFAKVDDMSKRLYDQRTDVNRDAKSLRARVDAIKLEGATPTERRDIAKMTDDLAAVGKSNSAIYEEEQRRIALSNWLTQAQSNIEAAKRHHAKMVEEFKVRNTEFQALAPIGTLVDATALRKDIDEANEWNARFDRFQQRQEMLNRARELEGKSDALSDAIEDIEKQRRTAIASAELPAGLSFGEGAVLLAGLPFDQASDAEQLRASTELAMATCGKLRVARIRDGSLLDESSLAMVAKMADEKDVQVWIEQVDSSGSVGFVIEDGHARKADEAS